MRLRTLEWQTSKFILPRSLARFNSIFTLANVFKSHWLPIWYVSWKAVQRSFNLMGLSTNINEIFTLANGMRNSQSSIMARQFVLTTFRFSSHFQFLWLISCNSIESWLISLFNMFEACLGLFVWILPAFRMFSTVKVWTFTEKSCWKIFWAEYLIWRLHEFFFGFSKVRWPQIWATSRKKSILIQKAQ